MDLRATITRVLYPPATSTEADWFILATSQGIAKGKMSYRPQDGEQLILDVEYAVYRGEREFRFASARLDVPTNARDQLRYVCLRTSGLGPAAESQIWDARGAEWKEIQPGDVPRLKGRLYEEFRLQIEALEQKGVEAAVVAALIGKGCTPNMAQSAWDTWKGETLGVVASDPYRLAELPNYGFKDVDVKIRQHYGIADDDQRRIKAAVIYSLRRLTDDGNTVVQWEDLFSRTCGMLGGYADLVAECTAELFEGGELKGFTKSEGVSLASDWKAESAVWDYVTEVTK
jgi:hypothetical protein